MPEIKYSTAARGPGFAARGPLASDVPNKIGYI
jgi:hypothetical protein